MENFTPKNPAELELQLQKASQTLGESIAVPSKIADTLGISLEDLKVKFPRRYEAYLKLIRAEKNNQEIPQEDLEHFQKWIRALNNLDRYIESQKTEIGRTLREKQVGVFEDMRDFVEEGGQAGYVKLPTGFGKTVIFSQFVEALGLRTLIAVPKKNLVHQTAKSLERFTDLDVGKLYQYAKEHDKPVTVSTYQSMIKETEDGGLKPEEYDCLILDEAHKALGPKSVHTIEKFDHALRLGFTATPQYSETKGVQDLLETEIHSISIKEAVDDGALSSFSVILARTKVDLSKVKVKSDGEYDEKDLEKAINVASRNMAAINLYKKMFNGKHAMAYCAGVEHAREVARLFNEAGIKSVAVAGEDHLSEEEMLDIFEKFRSGEIKVITNADIFVEGFDEPKASVCLNLRPTASPVVAEQRGGRVLRLDPSDENKHAFIVDFVDEDEKADSINISFAEVAEASEFPPRTNSRLGEVTPDQTESVSREKSDIVIEGLELVTDPNEVMRLVQNKASRKKGTNAELEAQEIPKCPEGWLAVLYFSDDQHKKYGLKRYMERSIISRVERKNAHLFGQFRSERKTQDTEWFLSPEAQALIEKDMAYHAGWDLKERGYTSGLELSKRFALFREKFRHLEDEISEADPQAIITRTYQRFYSADAIKEIEAVYGKFAPEGWIYRADIFRKYFGGSKTGGDAGNKLVEKLKKEMPDEVDVFVNRPTGHSLEFYSPRFVEEFGKRDITSVYKSKEEKAKRIEDKKREGPPSGWFPVKDIVILCRIKEPFLRRKLNDMEFLHDNEIKNLAFGFKTNILCATAKIIRQIILDDCKRIKTGEPPAGWQSTDEILQARSLELQDFYYKLLSLLPTPETMKRYTKKGVTDYYFSPDFLAKL
ncbi:MAG: DEAD/DEAH box helicase [Candidatus Pacebacteria bacterium]|nr:DEAD/DEAH box helicase [Candidatus Paceibacterota bacterium]MDD5356922.1 DEAD/DEAH box helicase [Candidatus Paceibacterota bacterium]